MAYKQISNEERYLIGYLRIKKKSYAEIGRETGRHRSTIKRELVRNKRKSGDWGSQRSIERTRTRRSHSRRGSHFTDEQWKIVIFYLEELWSPQQISNHLKKEAIFSISHQTIYRYIAKDRKNGGKLYKFLRHSGKIRRKAYGGKDSRGRLSGKRNIAERPLKVEDRTEVGHYEIDLMHGSGSKHCLLTLVERRTGYTFISKLKNKTAKEVNRGLRRIIRICPDWFKTITADNGSEFNSYKKIEKKHGVIFYFANPYHSWERGTNENTNGLIRQYLPKRLNLIKTSQKDCDYIAGKLNQRPRKRLGYRTPNEAFYN